MKQKKKLWLIVAALLLMLSFLFSRISISTDGIGGWVLLGIGGLFFCSGNPFARCPRQKIGNVQRFAVCGKDKKTSNCYHNSGGDTDGFD